MTDVSKEAVGIEWPREIWAEERQEGDMQGLHVFSQHAAVPRFDGDCEYHRYVDADIYDSQVKWAREMIGAHRAELDRAEARVAKLEAALETLRRDYLCCPETDADAALYGDVSALIEATLADKGAM